MYEYSHGGNAVFEDGKESVIDLSANINPLGMPEGVKSAIIREVANCEFYPDNFSVKLREKIAEFEKIKARWIFCGNGASDIIFRLPRAAGAKKVMITAPTFSDYERSARSFRSEVIRHTLSERDGFILGGDFIEAVHSERPGLVFVCNPNNPTGKLTEAGLIERLLGCCKQIGAIVAVDECFLEFAQQPSEYTSKVFLERYSNLVILKAFTKLFGLPGIRLGYAMCADKTLVDNLYYNGSDWPVSNLAGAAGMAALDDAESFIRLTVSYITEQRTAMESNLARLGYRVFQSEANYVFLQNPYPFELHKELDKMGIRIRSCGNYHGLDGSYYRIAVSQESNNAKLLCAIEHISEAYKNNQPARPIVC